MSHPDSRASFIRFRPTCPITGLLVVVAVSLQLAVSLKSGPENAGRSAYRDLGGLVVQQADEHPELFGPFDLWAGEWWRVPMGGLLHTGWWHLGIVAAFFLYLGKLLEPHLRRVTYLPFVLGAIFVTTLPRWQFGDSVPAWFNGEDPVTGLSGVLFAQFGVLLFLRGTDRRLSQNFSEGSILVGIVFGLGCLAGSTVGFFTRIDNLAHMVGLGYGLIWGVALSASGFLQGLLVAGVLALHGFLWPAFEGLIHPEENGRYHWWRAENADDPESRRQAYRLALQFDPALRPLWIELAEAELQNQQPQKAWTTLHRGLTQYPHLAGAEELSRRIWAEFSTKERRREAWKQADRYQQNDSGDWSDRLLSPRQSAEFLLETRRPLKAWASLVRQLRDLPPPSDAGDVSPETSVLADAVWQKLSTRSEQLEALAILDDQLEERRRAWHQALVPNRVLIFHYRDLGELLWAWRSAMSELQNDPAFEDEGKRIAREIWRSLPTDLRRERARGIVEDLFGADSLRRQAELGILSEEDRNRYRLDQSVELPESEWKLPPPEPLPPVDPDHPQSAAEGRRL